MNQSQFAEHCNVKRAAITYAKKHDLVHVEPDGSIDPEHPTNQAYYRVQMQKQAAGATKGKGRKPKPATVQSVEGKMQSSPPRAEPVGAYDRKLEEDIKYRQWSTRKLVVDVEDRMGKLIDKEVVQRHFSALDGELRVRFLDLGKRLAPSLIALVRSGAEEREVIEMIETEIGDALERVKDAAKRNSI